ncbi:oxidoreductase, FAD-binding [Moritella sp. PE36]|uniref:2Fe-2S iron-sulfur cluster-binding protein n=1 Tax=Moritella sp. PE36 TaxID=58051 RepID=UPI0001568556|nr:pyridoxamine 5'-phosphate oxidase family protein [Moritella sp. PE36]EDM67130.1 oxidoreductase, FAD-binding [Moritella sp. PE36]
MDIKPNPNPNPNLKLRASPFHRGEQTIQEKLGVREQMERFGSRVIRDHMPQQHRDFYQQLPFIFVGHGDKDGWPWASILFNKPGFIHSPDEQSLHLNTQPVLGDPLLKALDANTKLGLLGIELETRRRNRLAAHITASTDKQIQLSIDQSFGNCPQYIQKREYEFIDPNTMPKSSVEALTELDLSAQQLIANSDTFFVASFVNNDINSDNSNADSSDASIGADVSHRGGKPGFIRVDNNKSLTIPDYLGNNHFNTLGNFVENPKAGLLFIDFDKGHILTLTGRVEILWQSEDSQYFTGAERLWTFHLEQGYRLNYSLPLRWKLNEFSPNTLMTGTWAEVAKQKAQQEQQKKQQRQLESHQAQWHDYQVVNIVDESSLIKSFYLQPTDTVKALPKFNFTAGQFLTVKVPTTLRNTVNGKDVIRTYTISSAPADPLLRISVKRETSADSKHKGLVSHYLHDNIKLGHIVQLKAPKGDFVLDAAELIPTKLITAKLRPTVLLAGGVGITPMIAMARHAMFEAIRTRSLRPITVIAAAKNAQQRAFFDEFNQLSEQSQGGIRTFWALSQPESDLKPGQDYHHQGRINKDLLQAILPIDDYDFYLCGPSAFMQSMYDLLRELGVSNERIKAEEFGPASLTRQHDASSVEFIAIPSASVAVIEFNQSEVEQTWTAEEGTLLEFAENHGLTPEFGCRSGQCGACKTKLLAGKVSYQTEISADLRDDEVLLCCAVPAAIDGEDVVRIKLEM